MAENPEVGTAAELAELFPSAREIKVLDPLDRKKLTKMRPKAIVTVRPLNLIEAAQLIAQMGPLFEAYEQQRPVMQLLTDHAGAVVDLAALATDRDGAWLRSLDAGDQLDVMVAVIEVNENFLRRVADLVAGPTGKRLAMLFNSGGQTPSSSLPSTASLPRPPLSSLRPRSK